MSDQADTPAARIRASARAGAVEEAARLAAALLTEVLGRPVGDVAINRDIYSLNSVNGFAVADGGEPLFFKFHQEEGEEAGVGEYYNAQVLHDAGYQVDMPLAVSQAPGRQVLVYRRRQDRRLSDVCADLERQRDPVTGLRVTAAQSAFDDANIAVALATLHTATADDVAAEPIHQLFHHRLVDRAPGGGGPGALGGRAKAFYVDGRFDFDGWSGSWSDIAGLTWRINGLDYPMTLADAFDRAFRLLNPAFAGRHVPALLAEVKATFHNVFAHPFWLYDPAEATRRYTATVCCTGDVLEVETDHRLSPLRHGFLASKAVRFWRPLLGRLAAGNQLAADWQDVVRAALFACPTLVMDLTAASASAHTPTSSAIGLAMAMQCACPPAAGTDDVSRFLTMADPAQIPP